MQRCWRLPKLVASSACRARSLSWQLSRTQQVRAACPVASRHGGAADAAAAAADAAAAAAAAAARGSWPSVPAARAGRVEDAAAARVAALRLRTVALG